MENCFRQAIVDELKASFGQAVDVTPADGQPAHVLLQAVQLVAPWKSPARGLVRFTNNWPEERPEFFVALDVVDSSGTPPRNNGGSAAAVVMVLGESWRQFSFNFVWPQNPRTATRAVQLWLNRFRLPA
jgi:hypothetical protein